MKITTIAVTYGQTQSLPEYSNVKPQITIGAELEPGDDPAAVAAQLWETARAEVHLRIDEALERNGEPAKYDAGPRFDVVAPRSGAWRDRSWVEPENVVAIVPAGSAVDGYSSNYKAQGHRYAFALRLAERHAAEKGARLIDASDGDLSKIPAPPKKPEPAPEPAPEF